MSEPENERPETGLISDEQLPADVRPTEDNPLAQDPKDPAEETDATTDAGPGGSPDRVEGMPDMGPGAPA